MVDTIFHHSKKLFKLKSLKHMNDVYEKQTAKFGSLFPYFIVLSFIAKFLVKFFFIQKMNGINLQEFTENFIET